MATRQYRWFYSVLGPTGVPGERYYLETRWGDYLPGVAMSAAEDFNGRPEASSTTWPATFVIFSAEGVELGRHLVKRWFLPCFLTVDPEKAERRERIGGFKGW